MASNALAPYAASMIGQQFGHGENRNEAAQLLSHAVLGAVLAQVNGGSAAAGAVSAAGAEAASNYIAKELYPYAVTPNGDIDASLLTPEQRQNLSSLGAAVGAIGGGLVGNSLYNAAVGSQVGQNAVVNNETGSTKYNSLSKEQAFEEINKALANGDLDEANKLYKAYDFGIFTKDGSVLLDRYSCVKAKGADFCSANNWQGSQIYNEEKLRDFALGFAGVGSVKITSLVKADSFLLKEARALSQQESQGINQLLSEIRKGNMNPGIGTKYFDGIAEFRHRNGGRIYAKVKDGVVDIIGYSGKANQQNVINRIKQLFK